MARLARIDVAAEHLRIGDGRYRLGGGEINGRELLRRLEQLTASCNIGFLEDPFDAADTDLWRELVRDLQPTTCVVGDDLLRDQSRLHCAGCWPPASS